MYKTSLNINLRLDLIVIDIDKNVDDNLGTKVVIFDAEFFFNGLKLELFTFKPN